MAMGMSPSGPVPLRSYPRACIQARDGSKISLSTEQAGGHGASACRCYGLARSLTLQAPTDPHSQDTREVPLSRLMWSPLAWLWGHGRRLGLQRLSVGRTYLPIAVLGLVLSLGPDPAGLGEAGSEEKGSRDASHLQAHGDAGWALCRRSCTCPQLGTGTHTAALDLATPLLSRYWIGALWPWHP